MKPFSISTLFLVALLLSCAFNVAPASAASSSGNDEDERFVAVKAGLIIPVEGDPIENGIIVIRNGVIDAIGKNVEYPRKARIVDASDSVVIPGLVNPCSLLGQHPYFRSGVHADLKAADEFLLNPEVHDDLLKCGFTTFGIMPPGKGFPGQAMAMVPKGDTREEWTLNDSAYVFATLTRPSREKKSFMQAFDTAQKEIEKQEKARKDWEEKQKKAKEEAAKKKEVKGEKKESEKTPAPVPDDPQKKDKPETKEPPKKGEPPKGDPKKDGKKADKKEGEKKPDENKFVPPPINPPYKPLVDLIRKKEGAKLLVQLSRASDFIHLEEIMKKIDIETAYLLHSITSNYSYNNSTDFFHVADKFGEAKAEVIFSPVIQTRPNTANRINMPAEFVKAGCSVSLAPARDTESDHADFLRRVGMLVKAGMKQEDALRAITLNPARLLGLDKRIGTIEQGKDGNLLFLTDKPFSPLTRIEKVMIRGEIVAEGNKIQ